MKKPEPDKASEEKIPVNEEIKVPKSKAPESASKTQEKAPESTKKADAAKSAEPAKKSPAEPTKFKTEAPVHLEVVAAPVAAAAITTPAIAKAEEAKDKKPE